MASVQTKPPGVVPPPAAPRLPASDKSRKMSQLQPSGHILTNLLPNGRLLAFFSGQENPVGLAHKLLPTKAQLIKL
jgi:hypothetical protein